MNQRITPLSALVAGPQSQSVKRKKTDDSGKSLGKGRGQGTGSSPTLAQPHGKEKRTQRSNGAPEGDAHQLETERSTRKPACGLRRPRQRDTKRRAPLP